MDFYDFKALKNKSFLTFITETKVSIRGLDIAINDATFDDLVLQGILAIIYWHKQKKLDKENQTNFLEGCNRLYFRTGDEAIKCKEKEDYFIFNSAHLEDGCWPHYPVLLGIAFNDDELKAIVMEYAKENYENVVDSKLTEKELEQNLLIAVINAAVRENEGRGYKFVGKVKGTNEKFNAITLIMSIS